MRERTERTMRDYMRISGDRANSLEDREDFRNKAAGLGEALVIIDMILEQENYNLD